VVKVLITGVDGFIGRNLRQHLAERLDVEVVDYTSSNSPEDLPVLLTGVEFVFHLAGVNRPANPNAFATGNHDLTEALAKAAGQASRAAGRPIPILCTSSTQAGRDTPYGRSKRAAEEALFAVSQEGGSPAHVFRLPNVFGKWSRPNYNSAVATFCHNIARGLPIEIHDRDAPLTLVYIDDVVERFVAVMDGAEGLVGAGGFESVSPQYATTVGEVADLIGCFRDGRRSLTTERVGTGLARALHATYLSFLPAEDFAYSVPRHADPRGAFVEVLKTADSGQFSYFTAHPGITRGGHYHHSKTEKFLVIKGRARFRFRHLQTGERHELVTTGDTAQIVESVPGWVHDITNIGDEEMLVMLWANEVFDRARPDTFAAAVG
jgi:UDP-2-acetamido-2,6-beta-L-arabino-hexul-4-ose reductase